MVLPVGPALGAVPRQRRPAAPILAPPAIASRPQPEPAAPCRRLGGQGPRLRLFRIDFLIPNGNIFAISALSTGKWSTFSVTHARSRRALRGGAAGRRYLFGIDGPVGPANRPLLAAGGHLDLAPGGGLSGVFDRRPEEALGRAQRRLGVKADGRLEPPTITALARRPGSLGSFAGRVRAIGAALPEMPAATRARSAAPFPSAAPSAILVPSGNRLWR